MLLKSALVDMLFALLLAPTQSIVMPERDGIAPELSEWQQRLARAEERITSQGRQDGILRAILEDVGVENKRYVEFGFNSKTYEGGSGANTLQLQRDGWKGLLMDGGNENASINLHKELLGPHGIVELLRKYEVSKNVDYMSIDFDSYDVWAFSAVTRSQCWARRSPTTATGSRRASTTPCAAGAPRCCCSATRARATHTPVYPPLTPTRFTVHLGVNVRFDGYTPAKVSVPGTLPDFGTRVPPTRDVLGMRVILLEASVGCMASRPVLESDVPYGLRNHAMWVYD